MANQYATSPETNRKAESRVTVICEGKEAGELVTRIHEALVKENRRRRCHGDSELAYSVLASGFTTSMSP